MIVVKFREELYLEDIAGYSRAKPNMAQAQL